MPKYRLKYNFLILLSRLIFLTIFIGALTIILRGAMKEGIHWNKNLLGLIIFTFVIVFLIYHLGKRLINETNLITLTKDSILIYSLIKLKKQQFRIEDCIFFSSNRKAFDKYIIKTPTGEYIHILSYDYFDFKKLYSKFINYEIRYEGYLANFE